MWPAKPSLPNTVLFPLSRNVFFAESSNVRFLEIIERRVFDKIEIFVTEGGLLGFKFERNSEYAGGSVDSYSGVAVPDDIFTANGNRKAISFKRVRLANAISLLISSTLEEAMQRAGVRHYSINAFAVMGALYDGNTLQVPHGEVALIHNFYSRPLNSLAERYEDPITLRPDLLVESFDNIERSFHLNSRLADFSIFENLALLKQTRVLHSQQAFDASFVIGWAALESLIDMAFYCFELVAGKEQRIGRPKTLNLQNGGSKLSNGAFKKLGASGKIEILCENKFIQNIHPVYFEQMKIARNNLMHDASPTTPEISGQVATFARDFYKSVFDLTVKPEGSYTFRD